MAFCLQLPTTSGALGQAPQQLPPGSAAGGGGPAAGLQGHLGAAFSSEAQRQQQGSPASFPSALGRGGAALGQAGPPQAYADIFRAKGPTQLSSSAPHTISQPRTGAGHGTTSGEDCRTLRGVETWGAGHSSAPGRHTAMTSPALFFAVLGSLFAGLAESHAAFLRPRCGVCHSTCCEPIGMHSPVQACVSPVLQRRQLRLCLPESSRHSRTINCHSSRTAAGPWMQRPC